MPPPSRILIVEDHPDHRIILRYQLHSIGVFDVLEAPDGQHALALVARGEPLDLIIMNLGLPGLDGWETTRRIRALPGPRSRIPILAYTAYALPSGTQRALAACCDDYLTKPLLEVRLVQQKVTQLLAKGPTP
jgi:CheY-like chemotaxis protein